MNNNSEELIKLFKQVSRKGWIEGVGKSWGNIGLTFEHEIGKLPDSNYKPDFNDIEIKCSTRYSHYPMYLFTIAFDNSKDEVIRLANLYGHKDSKFPDKKVLFKKVTNSIVPGNKYNFFFDVDKSSERVYLKVYSNDGNLLEKESYINFSSIKEHLETKLKKLAYIKASRKYISGKNYYRYYYLALYKLKDFETFLELIEKNIIVINIISRISKSGDDAGRYRNKNVEFAINEDNIPKLFDCLFHTNLDMKSIFTF